MKNNKWKFIFISFFYLITSISAQQANPLEDLKRGARILAYQYLFAKEPHKAKTMAKFLTIIDENNQDNERLINAIKNNDPVKLEAFIEDKGVMYSDFLLDLLKILPENNKTREKRNVGFYICTVINPDSQASQFIPKDQNYSKFYHDIFEGGASPLPPDNMPKEEMDAKTAASKVIIESLNYNPTEFLEAVNLINYKLRNTGTQVEIESEKVIVEFVDEDNGYKIMTGPKIKAHDKNVFLKNLPLIELLKFIEHTTWLTYSLEGNTIKLVDSKGGEHGRPQYFKLPESLQKDMQESLFKAQNKYNDKTMQIKGTITQIKDSGSIFYIELNGIFVVVVNKNKLKDDSIKIITERFNEYAAAKKEGLMNNVAKNRPYMEVVVRGTCKIVKFNQIFINDCYSVLAEDAGHFYTK